MHPSYDDIDTNYTDAGVLDGISKSISRATGFDNKFTVASGLWFLLDKTGVLASG
jgi:hypothetical protein